MIITFSLLNKNLKDSTAKYTYTCHFQHVDNLEDLQMYQIQM